MSVKAEKGLLKLDGFSSAYILSLLEAKHAKDVFIPECKNGETWGARDLLKLDAWCLLRTYSPLTIIGYEIKCTRADFEQDQKWVKYLDLCHQFYFVCPAGLIHSTDLPSGIGLMWVSSSGKLRIKERAERRTLDSEKLNGLLIYALMSRSKIVASMLDIAGEAPPDRLEELRLMVETAKERKELASFIKGHIREVYDDVNKKHLDFKRREELITRFEEQLAKLGIRWDSSISDWQRTNEIENEINLLGKRIDDMTLRQIEEMGRRLIAVAEAIKKYRQ